MDTIISLLGLFIGGGGGAFFTWRYMRRKAKAEAESAEVDTVKNMQDVVSNMQGAYDKMLDQVNHYIEDATGKMEEMRSERDRYKKERIEEACRQIRTFSGEPSIRGIGILLKSPVTGTAAAKPAALSKPSRRSRGITRGADQLRRGGDER